MRLLLDHGRRDRAFAANTTRRWCRFACRLLGIQVVTAGSPPDPGALVVANHMGYADILAMGSAYPTFFLTPHSMSTTPLLKQLVLWSGQPIVTRERNRGLKETADAMRDVLAAGETLTAYLEGTSTGGDRVIPFIPSLFQPAIATGAPVVPCGLRWSSEDPAVDIAEDIAYWKDHELAPHARRFMSLVQPKRALLRFGDPIPTRGRNRKEIAAETHTRVCELSGLPSGPLPEEYQQTGHVLLRS